jgi:triosephosphate isomerase
VIVGHSERRQFFGETDETVNKKAKACLEGGLTPIICVGETLEERQSEKTLDVLERQTEAALSGIEPGEANRLLLAYEPVWAIGTGLTAEPAQAEEAQAFIRKKLSGVLGGEISEALRILYGGSVKPENAEELLSMPNVDGALVGGASLKVDSFVGIIRGAERALSSG